MASAAPPPTGLVVSARFVEHRTGSDHPERPDRVTAIRDRLAGPAAAAASHVRALMA